VEATHLSSTRALAAPQRELVNNTQPILLALQQKIRALKLQLQSSAAPFLFKV
jgi:hypothetical protein